MTEPTDWVPRAFMHALRNQLTPALLLIERLQAHQDPAVRATALRIANSLEHVTAMLADAEEAPVSFRDE